jgi:cellulose synthase operon protein C
MNAARRCRLRVEKALQTALFVLGAGLPTLAHAQAAPSSLVQPENLEVARLLEEAARAEAPQAALKRIFALWDQADPDSVEQALLQAESKVSAKNGAKAYASLLVAEARLRRGDRQAAAQRVSKLGFVTNWAFVGPFDDEGRIGIGTAYQPEAELLGPIVLGRAFDGKPRTVRWRVGPSEVGAVFDFGDYVRPREQTCGYASSFVRTARPTARDASVWLGWEGAFKLWWNGELVTSDVAHRAFDYDRVAGAVRLEPGWNRVTVKVCSTSSPKFALRLADDRGEPLAFEAKNDPAISEEVRQKRPLPKTSSVKGPLTLLSERAAGERATAKDLEALARYLHATGGNPIGEHRPRDLAIRAAELEPNWERTLFAAELVEDRNQATRWVEKAEALAKGDARGEIQVLLTRAALHRSSVNFRDATPFYEEVLRRSPDNLVATLGRVELFIQAGMPRTALGILERSLERFPRRVALLKVHAAQLRAVGRDSEADAVDARWFAFRADDASFLSKEVDRSIARDDFEAAERWITRLLLAESDAAFSGLLAARAYRSMGQSAKAKAALEAALELAPEETGVMRVLGDLAGEAGDRATQIRYLQRILQQNPQDKATRDYLTTLAPEKPRADEALAWDAAQIAERAKSSFGKGGRMRTLRKLSVTTVFENGLANRFYQVVFQPLTEEAAAEARQYFTAFEGSRQAIDLRLAKVYRADGSVAEALESGEGAANDPSIAMYTSTRTFFVSFPRLSPGDIIEVRYRIDDVTVKNDVKDAFYDVDVIQERDPILEAEYVLVAPKSKALTTFVSKLPGSVETTESGDQTTRKLVVKELVGVPPEPAQAPGSEIAGQIHVSTFKSWEEIGAFYWNLSKDMLDVDEEVRKVTQEIAKTHKDEASRVRAVYRFATNLRYVALEFGIEGIRPRRCALTLARGWGDCKDKATVIVTMLRELGIPSTLVLVRTQQRGDLPPGAPPSLGVFDHAIAYVPSLDLYLDGTAEGSGSTELPEMDRGAVALQINEGRAKLVRLPNAGPEASPHERRFDLTLAADGTATFVAEKSVAGVNAPSWRGRYASAGTRKERATKDFSQFFGPVEPSSVTVKDADDVERPFQIVVKGKAAAIARREGEAWSIPTASSLEFGRGLVAPSSRQTELVIGALSESHERRTFKLPGGAKVERMPRATKLSTAFGDLSIEATQEGGRVVVESRLSLKKSRIAPAEYEAFRDFCLKADEALSQRLVWRP